MDVYNILRHTGRQTKKRKGGGREKGREGERERGKEELIASFPVELLMD